MTPPSADRHESATTRAEVGTASWETRAIFVAVVLAAALLLMFVISRVPSAILAAVLLTPIVVLVLGACLVSSIAEPFLRRTGSTGLCPSCGYDTAGLQDRVSICPECGSVWELPEPTSGSAS